MRFDSGRAGPDGGAPERGRALGRRTRSFTACALPLRARTPIQNGGLRGLPRAPSTGDPQTEPSVGAQVTHRRPTGDAQNIHNPAHSFAEEKSKKVRKNVEKGLRTRTAGGTNHRASGARQ